MAKHISELNTSKTRAGAVQGGSKHRTDCLRAVLLDCGDTLVDEGTEIKNALEETQEAGLIPGAAEAVHELVAMGYRLGLVADGPTATFENVLGHYGLLSLFEVRAISQEVGVEKPEAAMFVTALERLGIGPADYGRVVMVGNNLARDIAGANALGLLTVWLDWSPRRSKIPANALEVPDYTISSPAELPFMICRIEQDAPWTRAAA